jgi:hypothetical protein
MRNIAALCLYIAWTGMAGAQQCCECTCADGRQATPSYTPSSFPDAPPACLNECTAICQTSDNVADYTISDKSCRPPVASIPDALAQDVYSAIYRDGARIWLSSTSFLGLFRVTPERIRQGEDLRNALASVRADNNESPAYLRINRASAEELQVAAFQGVNRCTSERDIYPEFERAWGGSKYDMWEAHLIRNYDAVRTRFSNAYKDDVDLRNRIYCWKNSSIARWINRLGDPGPAPAEPVRPEPGDQAGRAEK